MKIGQIAAKFGLTLYTTKSGKRFWYKDNGSNILWVGHGDTVQDPGTFQPVQFKTETRIYYPTADDRVGLYVALCYLPKAKVKVDILLTEDEEDGRSTALWFDPPKKYNWMFMFDRKGTGAVTYQYDNEQLRYKLNKHNFVHEWGTYSCIRDLEHLGICGINFGAGYYDNHSEFAYVNAQELRRQLRKFIDFYKEYRFVRMPHDVGYERFAQAVNYHSYESDREYFEKNKINPGDENKIKARRQLKMTRVPVEEMFGKGDIIEAEFVEVKDEPEQFAGDPSIDESSFDDWHYKDYGEYRQEQLKKEKESPDKSIYYVTEGGKLKRIEERLYFKLYWPISNLKFDTHHTNILRNTFGVHYVYDLVKLSPFKLVTSGMFAAHEVDHFVREVQRHGFDLRFNLQGLKTPALWHQEHKQGWKKREKILRTSSANKKPTATNKRLQTVAVHKHEEAKSQPTERKRVAGKHILVYPLPGTDIGYVLKQMRDLQKGGYDIEARYVCASCKADNEFDINQTDQLPKFCAACHREETPASSVENQNTGEEVYTKIQLRKDATDETQFEYIGKDSGRGIEKYEWKVPGQKSLAYKRADGADIYFREPVLK